MAVADILESFETWLRLANFENATWIRRHLVVMVLKKSANEVQEARKKGRRVNKRPATDLVVRAGKTVRANIPELPNTSFMVVIR